MLRRSARDDVRRDVLERRRRKDARKSMQQRAVFRPNRPERDGEHEHACAAAASGGSRKRGDRDEFGHDRGGGPVFAILSEQTSGRCTYPKGPQAEKGEIGWYPR